MRSSFTMILALPLLAACSHTPEAAPAPPPERAVACPECPISQELSPAARVVLAEAAIPPDGIACNSLVEWRPEFYGYGTAVAQEIAEKWGVDADKAKIKQARRVALGYLVRTSFEHHRPNNLGVTRLGDLTYPAGDEERPLLLYRSATHTDAAQAGSCYQSLIDRGQVRHVVNLYAGTFPFAELIEAEERVAAEKSVTFHNEAGEGRPWRSLVEEPEDYEPNVKIAMERAAEILNTQVLRPKGQAPTGNVLLHCGGGMHRTGMLYGILQRCVNQTPMDEIEVQYKQHVAYSSEEQQGGFEPLNLRFIREFDCKLLDTP